MKTEQETQIKDCIEFAEQLSIAYREPYFALSKSVDGYAIYAAISKPSLAEYLNDGYMFLHNKPTQ